MKLNSLNIKAMQTKVLATTVAVIASVIGVVLYVGAKDNKPSQSIPSNNSVAYDFSKDVDAHGFQWEFSRAIDEHKKEISELKDSLNEKAQFDKDIEGKFGDVEQKSESIEERLASIEDTLLALASKQYSNKARPAIEQETYFQNTANDMDVLASDAYSYQAVSQTGAPVDIAQSIALHTFALEPVVASSISNISNTIPSNSFINATLSNGVDVSASQSSQQNPKPVLLTITGWGNLPNGHKLKTLKECRVHATAWGDMSSERVYMSPDLLTCIDMEGNIIETSVQGYVTGEDGSAGMRGRMVTRDKDLVQTAVIAGTLSGIGEAFASTQGTRSISPLGATETYNTSDIAKVGVGKGVGTGLDMLAKYKIKQAEHLHPIIQINGGRQVDIVFYTSATIGSTNSKIMPSDKSKANPGAELLQAMSALNQIPGDY